MYTARRGGSQGHVNRVTFKPEIYYALQCRMTRGQLAKASDFFNNATYLVFVKNNQK